MAAPTFRNEDDEAQFCLGVLRDGTHDAKIVARERLAAIFMRRGLFAEAVEAYELNLRAGVRTPDLLQRLAAAYEHIGDHAAAAAARAEAERVRTVSAPQPAPSTTRPAPPPPVSQPAPAPSRPTTVHAAPATGNQPSAKPPDTRDAASSPATAPASSTTPVPASGTPPRVVPFPTPPPPAHQERDAAVGDDAPGDDDDDPRSPAALRADRDRDRWLGLGPVQGPPSPTGPYGTTSRLPAQWDVIEAAMLADAATESSARAGRTAPRPFAVAGAVVFLMLVPIVLLAMVVVNPIALYVEGRPVGPTLDTGADPSASPAIRIAPGATVEWYIRDGRAVSGLWATPGLDLVLDQPLAGVGTTTVSAARAQSWGETITIVERRGQGRSNQELLLPASLTVPGALPPPGTVITGRITGPVTAPRLSESSQFSTTTTTIDLPVRLAVAPGWELWADRFVHACGLFFHEDRWLLVTVVSLLTWCVLAGGTALAYRLGRRRA